MRGILKLNRRKPTILSDEVEVHPMECECGCKEWEDEDYSEEEPVVVKVPVYKDHRVVVFGTKAWNETYRKLMALGEYVGKVKLNVKEEDTMETEKPRKKRQVIATLKKGGEVVVKAARDVKVPTSKDVGKYIGSRVSNVAKPAVSFIDGVREGWKNGS